MLTSFDRVSNQVQRQGRKERKKKGNMAESGEKRTVVANQGRKLLFFFVAWHRSPGGERADYMYSHRSRRLGCQAVGVAPVSPAPEGGFFHNIRNIFITFLLFFWCCFEFRCRRCFCDDSSPRRIAGSNDLFPYPLIYFLLYFFHSFLFRRRLRQNVCVFIIFVLGIKKHNREGMNE
jgi:hypothetical protein